MAAEDWQRALRRQFGRAQDFQWSNLGSAPVFSDFEVFNPASQGRCRVAIQRLAQRGWCHVFFHGGVPADQRAALVDRFHSDPACRLFLSTDAGSTGLNLQHAAATVVNMDLPWNPAVLAQRIGRVHRMGQRQGVQVINLVAQGGIEESIQGLLVFKQSLADGVLDGGDGAVFMEGGGRAGGAGGCAAAAMSASGRSQARIPQRAARRVGQ